MIRFTGPETISFPHARLLYQKVSGPENAWKNVMEASSKIDQIIESHPRLSFAHDRLHLYFFGPDASESWVGREIIGHLSRSPEGLSLFDSYQGPGFQWETDLESLNKISGADLISQGERLKSLAGEALAKTWRVEIQGMESLGKHKGGALVLGKVAFQFYKIV